MNQPKVIYRDLIFYTLCIILTFFITGCANDGSDGLQGPKGEPGEPGSTLSRYLLPKGTCTALSDGLWAEHIYDSGTGTYVFDIYYTNDCSDSNGEYCDNVVPATGVTGSVDPYSGSGTVCPVDNLLVFGGLLDNDDILVYVLEMGE